MRKGEEPARVERPPEQGQERTERGSSTWGQGRRVQLRPETLSKERRAPPASRGKGSLEIFLGSMIAAVWGHIGFCDMRLDVAVIPLVPAVWLEMQPNYIGDPVGIYAPHYEDGPQNPLSRDVLG